MEFCADLIGIVKTKTKVFCKDTIGNLTKELPGCYNLMLSSKPRVPRGRPLISIGYKYNARKVLSYIFIDKIWSTQAGLHYLSKYPDQFFNVSVFPIASPLVVYKFFGSVNDVDYHNKSRQSDLVLEKF